MYNNVYQDYINNIIGITPKIQSNFEYNAYESTNYIQEKNALNIDLECFYPEIYKLLYPMIQTACMKNTKPLTEDTINEMVEDIYSNFNADDVTVLNINLTNDVRSNKTSNSSTVSKNTVQPVSNKSISKPLSETRNEIEEGKRSPSPNNFILNDLIRILLIRELLGKPVNHFPNRPIIPGGNRPPFRPREIASSSQEIGIYEPSYMYSEFNPMENYLKF